MSDLTRFGPGRIRETVRRVCLLGGALAAAWCAVKPIDALYRVRAVDFAKLQKQDARRMRSDLGMMSRVSGIELDPDDPTLNPAPTLTLEEYVARETKDRLIEVSGSGWREFAAGVEETLAGKATTFLRNAGTGGGFPVLYFPTDSPPLNELEGRLHDGHAFTYLAVNEGGSTKSLEVLFQRPQETLQDVPNRLFYPWRGHSGWWFLAGLLAYVAIPWYRKRPDELRYSTARSMVGPDLLGMVMTVFFMTLPVLVITGNASGSEPLDVFGFRNGWWPVTLALWLLACGGLATGFTALWYATFSLRLTPTHLQRRTLFTSGDYAFSEMVSVEPARWAWPPWLRIVVILIGLSNRRLLGPVLLGSSEEAHGLAIRMRDGRVLKLWVTQLPGFERIFRALRQAGVPLEPELAKAIDEDLATAEPEPGPGRAGKPAAAVLVVLACLGTLVWQFWPETVPSMKREPTYTYEALAERQALLEAMRKVAEEMGGAAGTPRFDELMKQHDELEARYNAILPTEEE